MPASKRFGPAPPHAGVGRLLQRAPDMPSLRRLLSSRSPRASIGTVWLTFVLGACGPGSSPAADTRLATADSIVRVWVEKGRIPGAVVHVGRGGRTELLRAYGHAQVAAFGSVPQVRAMTTGTVFDLASLTKVMATTFASMMLVDRGRLRLDSPVSTYLEDFRGDGRETITVRDLLTHRSGLPQWLPTYYHASDSEEAYAYLRTVAPTWPVGEERHYSDLGFMLLGLLVEQIEGRSLDAFLREELYRPLGLDSTGFRPTEGWRADQPTPADPVPLGGLEPTAFAATSHGNPFERRMVADPDFGYRIDIDPESWNGWRHYTLSGEVNDGNAFHAFRGVAGHAGLFSTASELSVLLTLLSEGGRIGGRRFIDEEVVDRFLTSTGDAQALGWQTPDWAAATSFAHSGFTGTFVLGDRASGRTVVLLTNRQNLGVDQDARYPDVDALQRAVTDALGLGH